MNILCDNCRRAFETKEEFVEYDKNGTAIKVDVICPTCKKDSEFE